MDISKKRINFHMLLQILLFVVLIVIDQISKAVVVSALKGNPPVTVINGFAEFRYLENTGAAFGILENAMWFFYLITIVVFAVIAILWYRVNRQLKRFLSVPDHNTKTFSDMRFFGYVLAALAAGAIGNLIDRIANGYVVDFISFTFFNFPIFNFADICVTISVILICIFFLFIYKEDPEFKLFGKKQG